MSNGGNQQWHSRLAAALLITLPILVMFGPVLFADRSLAMRDAAHFYHPLLKWTTEQWLAGGPPVWNPYENTGTPLLADASSSLFYPGRLLLLLPIEFARRYCLYVTTHVALAALGSYLLARHWQASRLAAACAAIAYSCGGSVVFQHANVVFLVGAAWLPFAAWATDHMLARRSWRAAFALAIVLALMVLGGDPQMAYHAVLAAGIYALLLLFKPAAPARETSMGRVGGVPSLARRAGKSILLIGVAAGCGLALSAVQVLPSLEAAAESERAYFDRPRNVYEAASELTSRGSPVAWRDVGEGIFGQPQPTTHHERLYDFSLAPWRLIECVWPNVGGRMFPTHRRWLSLVPAEGRIWSPSLYFGLVPLLLALGQWRLFRTSGSQAWLSWLLLLFTLGSFGWYGLGWLVREVSASLLRDEGDANWIGSPVGGIYWLMVTILPGYVSFRYPAKLLIVAALAASQLAALGFDQALANRPARLLSCIKVLTIASVVLLVAIFTGFTWLRQFGDESDFARNITRFLAEARDPSLGPFDWRGCQRDICIAFLQTAFVGIAAHWLLSRGGNPKSQSWPVAALIAADILLANYWLVPTAPADIWRREPAPCAAIRSDGAAGNPRVYRTSLMRWRPEEFANSGSSQRLAELAAWERDTLFPKYGLPHGISLVESYGSLKSAHYESLLLVARQQAPPVPGSGPHELPHPSVLRLLGTEYLIVPASWRPNALGGPPWSEPLSPPGALPPSAALWRIVSPLPRAWIVHQVEWLPALKSRHVADVDERTREVLFPRSPGGKRLPRDFRTSAVAETNSPVNIRPAMNAPDGERCRLIDVGLDRVLIEARLTAPGLVVLSDFYAPGWRAEVESGGQRRPAPILRTNRVCRGILLPAGEHRIEMVCRPRTFLAGAWISGIGWVALAIAGGGLLVGQTALRAGGVRR